MTDPIVFGDVGADPGSVAQSNAAKHALAAALRMLAEAHHPMALLNALITVYVDLGVHLVGSQRIEEGLRMVLAQMPRISAVLQTDLDKPQGSA